MAIKTVISPDNITGFGKISLNQTTPSGVVRAIISAGSSPLPIINHTAPFNIESISFGVGRGKSVYDLAVDNGFGGSELDFLASIVGHTAYEVALSSGFVGSQEEWLNTLKGDSAYEVALSNGFVGTVDEWVSFLRSTPPISVNEMGFVLTNDGINPVWGNINELLNDNPIQWDLGEI